MRYYGYFDTVAQAYNGRRELTLTQVRKLARRAGINVRKWKKEPKFYGFFVQWVNPVQSQYPQSVRVFHN